MFFACIFSKTKNVEKTIFACPYGPQVEFLTKYRKGRKSRYTLPLSRLLLQTCRYEEYSEEVCYCCGHLITYVEHGEICTKYCQREQASGTGKYGQREPASGQYGQLAVILLPQEYDGPQRIRQENDKGTGMLNTQIY